MTARDQLRVYFDELFADPSKKWIWPMAIDLMSEELPEYRGWRFNRLRESWLSQNRIGFCLSRNMMYVQTPLELKLQYVLDDVPTWILTIPISWYSDECRAYEGFRYGKRHVGNVFVLSDETRYSTIQIAGAHRLLTESIQNTNWSIRATALSLYAMEGCPCSNRLAWRKGDRVCFAAEHGLAVVDLTNASI